MFSLAFLSTFAPELNVHLSSLYFLSLTFIQALSEVISGSWTWKQMKDAGTMRAGDARRLDEVKRMMAKCDAALIPIKSTAAVGAPAR